MKPYNSNDELMPGSWIMERDDRPMKKIDVARPLAWSLAALSLTLAVAGLVLSLRVGQQWLEVHELFAPVTALTYALVGALVAARHPRNPIGWVFSTVGVFAGLTSLSSNYTGLCLWSGAGLPCIAIGRWLSLWSWTRPVSSP